MTADLTRRRLLQATGATVAAGYVTSGAGIAAARPAPVPPLVTYPIPAGIAQASTFEVKVRTAAGPWTTVPTYSVNLKQINATTGAGQVLNSSMTYFDFSGLSRSSSPTPRGASRRPASGPTPRHHAGGAGQQHPALHPRPAS